MSPTILVNIYASSIFEKVNTKENKIVIRICSSIRVNLAIKLAIRIPETNPGKDFFPKV